MRIDTLPCGCSVAVPEDIERESEEMQSFLHDANLIRVVRVGLNRWDTICSQCLKALETDV